MQASSGIVETFEACFQSIRETRMAGVPILNEALEVRLLGLRDWEDNWLATLLTPWFMNLILIPETSDGTPVRAGSKRIFRFPSGPYEFIRGEEAETGPYWMCSLFSPVFEFSDQETAEACALAALDSLFEDAGELDGAEAEMQAIWRGEVLDVQTPPDMHDAYEPDNPDEEATLEPVPSKDLSRRALLTGGMSAGGRDGA